MTGGPEKPRTGQYELSVALRRLSREVAKSNEQIENGASFKGEDLCAAVDRFVDEFLRIPGAQAELERRAVFLKQSCGLGSEFHRLKSAAMEAYEAQPIKCDPGSEGPPSPTRLAVRDLNQLKRRVSVTLLDDLIGLHESFKRARDTVVRSTESAAAFDALLEELHRIRQDAERDEVDGCHFLWHMQDVSRSGRRRPWQRAVIREGSITGSFYPGSILQAAESLEVWALRRQSHQHEGGEELRPGSSDVADSQVANHESPTESKGQATSESERLLSLEEFAQSLSRSASAVRKWGPLPPADVAMKGRGNPHLRKESTWKQWLQDKNPTMYAWKYGIPKDGTVE